MVQKSDSDSAHILFIHGVRLPLLRASSSNDFFNVTRLNAELSLQSIHQEYVPEENHEVDFAVSVSLASEG